MTETAKLRGSGEELEAFLQKDGHRRVLLFPPLPSRLRYLIHRTVEGCPLLGTFSVGEGWTRRVVVCYSHLRLPSEEDVDPDGGLLEHVQETAVGKDHPHTEPRQTRNRAARRPDKAIYVPHAMRNKAAQSSRRSQARLMPGHSGYGVKQSSLGTYPESETSLHGQPLLLASPEAAAEATDEPAVKQEAFNLPSNSSRSTSPPAWDQTLSAFMAMSLEHRGRDEMAMPAVQPTAEPSADLEDLTQEITAKLREADVTIESARSDYSCYESVWLSSSQFAHVIEIYDFPRVFKTEDLLDAFADFSEGGLKITWVDDTSALGVFSSKSAAQQALSIQHPSLKVRTLSEGSRKARGKAFKCAEFIQPVKDRPRTDTTVARRLVTRALGLQRGGVRGKRCGHHGNDKEGHV